MNERFCDLKPAGWKTTATTIYCNLVEDEISIIVNKDWTYSCAWYNRYKYRAAQDKNSHFDRKITNKFDTCTGPNCSYVTGYIDKLIQEEASRKEETI